MPKGVYHQVQRDLVGILTCVNIYAYMQIEKFFHQIKSTSKGYPKLLYIVVNKVNMDKHPKVVKENLDAIAGEKFQVCIFC